MKKMFLILISFIFLSGSFSFSYGLYDVGSSMSRQAFPSTIHHIKGPMVSMASGIKNKWNQFTAKISRLWSSTPNFAPVGESPTPEQKHSDISNSMDSCTAPVFAPKPQSGRYADRLKNAPHSLYDVDPITYEILPR